MSLWGHLRKKIRTLWRLFRPHRRRAKLFFLRIFIRITPSESQRLFMLTLVVGALCGLVAVAFHITILAFENLFIDRAAAAPNGQWEWMMIATPVLGALISGILLYYVVPGARGSGIPQVKAAFEVRGGRLSLRDSIGKFLIGALQIGTGASLGREGPTVHICAGVASFLGKAAALSQENLRRLLPVGVAAGIAAAFNAPIAAVTFTIEEVVGDLDQTVLSGVIVAAAIAAAIERSILGEHPVFTITQNYGLHYANSLIFYAILGIAAAVVSLMFSESLLRLRQWFNSLRRMPGWAMPMAGGLVTGVLAVTAIYIFKTGGVTGGGYETLSTALSGTMALRVMAALCLMKLVATVFSYASGGSGGIFAPALFVGGMLGGTIGIVDVSVFHHPENEIGAFALVGMGAVFAGVIRAPITSVLIIFEMTGSYGLILPLMIANMTAYVVARHYRPLPIYDALLEQDGIFLPRRGKAPKHDLEKLTVEEVMSSDVATINAASSADTAIDKIRKFPYSTFPVVDNEGRCVGTITQARLERFLAENDSDTEVGRIVRPATLVYPEYSLSRAIVLMDRAKAIKLVVVERKSKNKLLGMLTMSDIVRAQARAFGDDTPIDQSIVPDAV